MRLLCVLALSGAPVWAADPPKPLLAQDTATITERNYFTNLNITAYSLTLGTLEIRADKQGPPCPKGDVGQRIEIRYDNKVAFLGPEGEKPECKLKVRQMEFTAPPQPR
jgi:hypothetical protein